MDTKIVIAVMALVVLGGAFYFGSDWWNQRHVGVPQSVVLEESVDTTSNPEVTEVVDETIPVVSSTPVSGYDKVAQLLTGKWRNEASQNQIFKIAADHSFEESYLTSNGEFMVPKGTWSLEKTSAGEAAFDPAAPKGALVFVRTSEKGESRRYEINSLTDSRLELLDLGRQSIVVWLRVVPTP